MTTFNVSGSPYDPITGFKVSDMDVSASPKYYGYLDYDGKWYIMKEESNTYRFARGSADYPSNWSNRASLTYGYFNEIF